MVVTLHFGSKVTDVDFDSRIQEYENKKKKKKKENVCAKYLFKTFFFDFDGIWCALQFFCFFFIFLFFIFFFFAEKSHYISSHPIKIEGEIPALVIKKKKKEKSWHIYRPICFKVEIMRDNTKLCSLMLV